MIPLFPPVIRSQTTGPGPAGRTATVVIVDGPTITIAEAGATAAETSDDLSAHLSPGDAIAVHGAGLGRLAIIEAIDGVNLTFALPWPVDAADNEQFHGLPIAHRAEIMARRHLRELTEFGPSSRWSRQSAALTIASGAIDLAAADGDWVPVIGTGTLTALGTVAEHEEFTLDFAGAVTVAPFDNLAVGAGDQVRVRSLGGGDWTLLSHLAYAA